MAQRPSSARARELIPPEILAHVPGFAAVADSATAQQLAGGTVNSSYRIETRAGRYAVRIFGAGAEELGADRAREALLHGAAASAGVAPALHYVDPQYRFMIMDFVEGRLWEARDLASEPRLQQLGAVLRALHEIDPRTPASFDVRALLWRHAQRVLDREPTERATLQPLLHRADDALRACGSHERAPTLIHGDLHHSNLIGDKRLYLLDWEYAAVTDPLFDLACLIAYYPRAALHATALLRAAGLERDASLEMLEHATWVYVLLSYLWYRARRLDHAPHASELALEGDLLQRLASV